ncbi:hypothetical protein AMEX_G10750 [Astyanax mexicanus]|uniref:Ig-like domain-containing protein n=1 Tax=Astyanax mexicanus TaxID=7994 RepID=A0A8T2LSU6_ASTMX|nr:hypothetical protein AMEX_G10750 [Astyanax mexicanus]
MFIYVFIFSVTIETVLGLIELKQTELSWTKSVSKTLYIKCKVTGLSSSNFVHWYQQKDGEAPRGILYVTYGTSPVRDLNHPDKEDFDVSKGAYDLKVESLKKIHSAVYYCACWDGHSDCNSLAPVQ